ncbi:putative thymocyte nuclear protein 1 [Rosellinia necatrix]|uniref:Thymocyte nuclear protein 1 n=1 Tax=Rosellinia necatrix TaxID=77044 RepID=A0A1W2TVF3_ROSNE|nr:putative thymocyte nuclear protein 1 [Rosellinia necatrix]
MPKRKAAQFETEPEPEPEPSSMLRRSTRRKPAAPDATASKTLASKQPTKSRPQSQTQIAKSKKVKMSQGAQAKSPSPKPIGVAKAASGNSPNSPDRWYWLLKAEPESRFENGVDVKFSIDDLASRTEPEPWDGIRAYAARNNLRSMKKGELAFFYHSNCKTPGLVGTMEIVQEHSPDLSAHDPKAPYYDPSSKPEDPKWSVVHVKFRSKFAQPIGLKELREMGKAGEPLEGMQMLKQSRLSVSRVSPSEWEYLMDLVRRQGGEILGATE